MGRNEGLGQCRASVASQMHPARRRWLLIARCSSVENHRLAIDKFASGAMKQSSLRLLYEHGHPA